MLFIAKKTEDQIKSEGEKAYPNECCGILLGLTLEDGSKKVSQIEAINNSREESEQYHRFLITPQELMKAEVKARSLKLDVLGFYHSHPDHPAEPSDYDREHALPFYSYVIAQVNNGKAKNFTSWELTEDRENFNIEEIKEED